MARQEQSFSIPLPSPDATARLGEALATLCIPGDVILLEGPIGAGKTHLARAFIQSRLNSPEEVPSPSFTLVQVYGERPSIWHADLFRLGHADEVAELGLDDAFGRDICLVEWPDRLGASRPADPLSVSLAAEGDGRRATLTGGPRWTGRLEQLKGLDLD